MRPSAEASSIFLYCSSENPDAQSVFISPGETQLTVMFLCASEAARQVERWIVADLETAGRGSGRSEDGLSAPARPHFDKLEIPKLTVRLYRQGHIGTLSLLRAGLYLCKSNTHHAAPAWT